MDQIGLSCHYPLELLHLKQVLVQEYKFRLPTVNYEVKPGHRIMVQIQSSLFPVYDRNPQKYVKNIFFAKPGDYQKATVSIEHGASGKSAVLLPLAQ